MPPTVPHVSNTNKRTDLIFHLLLIASMIVWGGSWVSAKILAQKLSPEMLAFWRFALSAVSFVPFMFMLPRPVRISAKGALLSIIGAVLMSVYMLFFFMGLEHWQAGHAGVLVTSLIPMMTLIISLLIFRKRPSLTELAGLITGMIGAAILLRLWEMDPSIFMKDNNPLLIVCPVIWAMLTICGQRASEDTSVYIFSFVTFALPTLFFLPFVAGHGLWTVFDQDANFWLNLFFLSVISGTISTTIFFIAAEKLGSYHASAYVFLVPLCALLLSWIFLGETPEATTIIGGSIAIVAVYLINRRPK